MKSTVSVQMIEGFPVTIPNVIASEGDDWYVSYNNHDSEHYGSDTTAIVIGQMEAFLILNGDHREALEGLTKEQACAYFHMHPEKRNKCSDHHEKDRHRCKDGKFFIERYAKQNEG